jgi:hypothetical protein
MASTFPIFNITQDMKPWNFKLTMTKGARSSKDTFSNDFLFASNRALGDSGLKDLALYVATAFSTMAHPTTRLLKVTLGPAPTKGRTKGSRSDFMTVHLPDLVGTRAVTSPKACALDICAQFSRVANYGPGGTVKLRGIFAQDEIDVTDSGYYQTTAAFNANELNNLSDFGNNLQLGFEHFNCGMILPATPLQATLGQLRPVVAFTYDGVSQRQVRNHRKSIIQAEQQLFKRQLKRLEKEAYQVLQGLGGSGALVAAAREMVSLVGPFVTQFGGPRVAGALAAGGEGAEVIAAALPLMALAV